MTNYEKIKAMSLDEMAEHYTKLAKAIIIKNEIIGCDNLMEFYRNKKIELIKELDRIQKIEIVESEEE